MKWPVEFKKEAINILKSLNLNKITPKPTQVLRFMNIDPESIKVVIIGQDPYPTKGVANGYAFAVNKGCPLPGSLKNIFKEIIEIKGKVSADETLEHWIDQGVLLLNTSLTTKIGESNVHTHLWFPLIKKIVKWLDDNFKVTWILWGNEAKKLSPHLKGKKLIDAHPSPLSFKYRNKTTFKNIPEIDW